MVNRPENMLLFPALTLIRFFDNHGLLGISGHPQWKVVTGGSGCYVPPLTAPLQDRVFTGVRIESIARTDTEVTVHFAGRSPMKFDQVVLACHGDEVLPLLAEPSDRERDILGRFRTNRNEVCLHTDSSLLPRRERARASWNYHLHLPGSAGATVTYYMNRLQSLPVPENYCVTLNGSRAVDPAKVIRPLVYHHPLYTRRPSRRRPAGRDQRAAENALLRSLLVLRFPRRRPEFGAENRAGPGGRLLSAPKEPHALDAWSL